MDLRAAPKELKASKHRIRLHDGRELQFHSPALNPKRKVEPVRLLPLLPPLAAQLPLEAEIGPGKGEFIARRAQAHPERFFVGVDRRADRIELTNRKMQRIFQDDAEAHGGRNWLIIHEDARALAEGGLPPLTALHVYQPDPWPKSKHNKNRFFRSPEARMWMDALVKGGELRFSSDHREYFEEIVDIVLTWGDFKLVYLWQKEFFHGAPQTHFEGIFLRKHEPVWKAVFIKL